MPFSKKRKKKKINLTLFRFKRLILKISKYILYLSILSIVIFLLLLKFSSFFREKLLNNKYYNIAQHALNKSCYNIDIEGVENANLNKINSHTKKYCSSSETNTNKYDLSNLKQDILEDPWIKTVSLRKELPYKLKIFIKEYKPFAIWKDSLNTPNLIDEEGNIINISKKEKKRFYNLLIISGKNSKRNIKPLFNLLLSNPEIASRIKTAKRIGSRRWNLELENGVIIKLPENNLIYTWKNLNKIFAIQGIELNLKTIDLRVPDKIFLEYDRKSFQEIKKI